jgi:hypothetical protein
MEFAIAVQRYNKNLRQLLVEDGRGKNLHSMRHTFRGTKNFNRPGVKN